MQHQEASIKVNWSKNYGDFRLIRGNRDISQAKINKLKRSVADGLDLFRYCPIVVDQEMRIIDGQHRFWACKELKLNVYYVVADVITIQQIAQMNANADKWKVKNFLECYIDLGLEDYKTLDAFKDKYGFNISLCMQLLELGTTDFVTEARGLSDRFRDGKFVVNHKEYAEQVGDTIETLKHFMDCRPDREFIRAIGTLLTSGKCNFETLLKKLELSKTPIVKKEGKKGYLSLLQEIYNFKTRQQITIY